MLRSVLLSAFAAASLFSSTSAAPAQIEATALATCASALVIQDFSTSTQNTLNLLKGNVNTDGTGTLTIASGKGTWSPKTSATAGAYLYTNLFDANAATGQRCRNLQPFGTSAAISVKLGKTTSSAANITVGVNLGCGADQTYATLGVATLAAGSSERTFTFPFSPAVSTLDLYSVKAILFTAGSDVPSNTVFTIDDLQVYCSAQTAPNPSCPKPVYIQDFKTPEQTGLNLLGGNVNTDGTGTLTATSSGQATWTPTISASSNAYWYSQLYDASTATSGNQCRNLSPVGPNASIGMRIGKTTSGAASLTIGVNVGCGSTSTFRTIGTVSFSGTNSGQDFAFPVLPALASPSDINSIKALVVIASADTVPSGSVFTFSDVAIVCY